MLVQGSARGFIKGDLGPDAEVWLSQGFCLLQPLGHAQGWGTVTQGHSTWPGPAPGLHTKDPLSPPVGQEPVCCAGCWLSEAGTAQGGWLEGFCQELSPVSRGLISCAGNTHAQATHVEAKQERFYWATPVAEERPQRHTRGATRSPPAEGTSANVSKSRYCFSIASSFPCRPIAETEPSGFNHQFGDSSSCLQSWAGMGPAQHGW